MTEKLRSGVNGKVREAIQQTVTRILVSVDGSLTMEANPRGLLGLEATSLPPVDRRDSTSVMADSVRSGNDRTWRLKCNTGPFDDDHSR